MTWNVKIAFKNKEIMTLDNLEDPINWSDLDKPIEIRALNQVITLNPNNVNSIINERVVEIVEK